MRRLKPLLKLAILVLLIWAVYSLFDNSASAPGGQPTTSQLKTNQPAGFNKQQHSIDKADSLWVVVNKSRILPANYAPANLVTPNVPLRGAAGELEMQLRSEAAVALEQLVASASAAKIKLRLSSGYRSYGAQQQLYQFYVNQSGAAAADESSARPGYSEHQTGLAADLSPTNGVCDIAECFADTAEGKWLAANAHQYGYIIRYQSGNQAIVGYEYEPWHIRYIGSELAAQLHSLSQTMEQFFGLPPASNYAPVSKQLSP